MAHRFSARPVASRGASQCSISALRAALFAALGLNLVSGCGAESADSADQAPVGGAPLTGSEDSTEAAGSSSSDTIVCRNPSNLTQLLTSSGPELHDTGYEWCDGGWNHRSRAVECPSALPRAEPVVGYRGDACEDTSCAGPHDFCITYGGPGPTSTGCMPGCVRDDECDAGQICFCDNPVGRCVQAFCTTDADCPGSLCVGTPNRAACGGPDVFVFACADPGDECLTGDDCQASGGECRSVPTAGVEPLPRQCRSGAACGRPFLVHGSPRRAGVMGRSDWASARCAPDVQTLDSEARSALAAHWTELGSMEHASVAAFARFVLELMAAGAPCELVLSAQRAMGDEIEHAGLCFGLASAYAGEALGPGALSAQGALDDPSLQGCVVRAIHEACVGETLAAVEALEALTSASDPAVIEVLRQVVRDESAHAELGWRFLQWALSKADPDLRALARSELQRAIDVALAASQPAAARPAAAACPELEQHGICDAARVHDARRQAVAQIVAPLGRALFVEPSEIARSEAARRAPADGDPLHA
jgi:hypothetical protein